MVKQVHQLLSSCFWHLSCKPSLPKTHAPWDLLLCGLLSLLFAMSLKHAIHCYLTSDWQICLAAFPCNSGLHVVPVVLVFVLVLVPVLVLVLVLVPFTVVKVVCHCQVLEL